MATHDSETIVNVSPILAAAKYYVTSSTDLAFDFGAATHAGLCRSENQDHYLVLRRTRTQQLLLTNMPTEQLPMPTDEAYAMAVADGMGGHAGGGLASELAIRTGWELAGRASSWVMKLGQLSREELTERVEAFTHLMQQAFVDEFRTNPDFGDSGTTWSAAYFVSSFVVVFNIGDSPCFLWRDGIMCRVSTDHTVEQEFMAAGVDREIAGRYGHMLTRCLGYDSQNARPDVYHMRLKPGDQVLLCTDGLTDMVSDTQIAQCLDESTDAQSACDGLVKLALAAGGRDNVTAILARAKTR
ncbi:MAG TPA: protein phosphatase 2C domain-containing protein [Lacipirellulaceae bacterium]|jgi:protein phosphatase